MAGSMQGRAVAFLLSRGCLLPGTRHLSLQSPGTMRRRVCSWFLLQPCFLRHRQRVRAGGSFVVTKRGLVLSSEEQTVSVQTLTSAAESFLWSLAFAMVPRAPRCARRHRAVHGPRWHGLRGCSGTWCLLPPASVGNTSTTGTAVIQTRKGDLQIILQHSLKQLIS